MADDGAELNERQLRKKEAKAAKAAKLAEKKAAKAAAQSTAKKDTGNTKATQKGGGRKGQKRAAATQKAEVAFVNTTPPGEKKDLSGEMEKAYNPIAVEAAWYDWWLAQGFFKADATSEKKPFVMTIPPPNVTGALHIGHALTNSVEDAIIRHRRMSGYEALWIPGLDHAGIATQTVVEKKLWKEEKLTRYDLGREKFLERAHLWKGEYAARIVSQLKRLGSSVDWNREFFTMDDNLSRAVQTAFVRMWDDGLIFRAERLVNWSCSLKTAISDIEVDHIELSGRTLMPVPGHGDKEYEFGVITSFAYKVDGTDEEIVVATTRPETMLGDTGVAVHPTDDRYKHLHGKRLIHPFVDRKIPIVLDDVLVDKEFGTGAVKVTPAHDANDFACGQRHKLEIINLLNEDGTMNENAGEFQGMKRFDAREAVLQALKDRDLYRGVQDNPMSLSVCSRSKDIIEPFLKPQWWVKCDTMAKRAADCVRNGEMQIMPKEHEQTWYRWLDNSRDWCISRQLWWGHRCPAFKVSLDGGKTWLPDDENDSWVAAGSEQEAIDKARKRHADVASELVSVVQDEDVLDTWFSSGLLPFSALGWPNDDTPDMKKFFQTQLLETGHDILFFWVARMVMMSLQLTGKVPFEKVYLHAMVRDAHGKKMSKSTGNVIDPVDMITGCSLEDLHKQLLTGNLDEKQIEKAKRGQAHDFPNGIPECGTDATRFALVSYTTQGRDINLDVLRVSAYRNFCNKLWNAVKFVLMNLDLAGGFVPLAVTEAEKHRGTTPEEVWILSRLNATIDASSSGWETYDFSSMTTAIHFFWRDDFCANFVEVAKPILQSSDSAVVASCRQTLYTCLDVGLRLIHPLMPFLSEELWQRLPRRAGDDIPSIVIAAYPTSNAGWSNTDMESKFSAAQEVVAAIRSMRSRFGLTKERPAVVINVRQAQLLEHLRLFERMIQFLGRSDNVTFAENMQTPPEGSAVDIVNENIDVYTRIKGEIDVAGEIVKLDGTMAKLQREIATIEARMAAPKFQEKVPQTVREETAARCENLKQQLENAETGRKALAAFE